MATNGNGLEISVMWIMSGWYRLDIGSDDPQWNRVIEFIIKNLWQVSRLGTLVINGFIFTLDDSHTLTWLTFDVPHLLLHNPDSRFVDKIVCLTVQHNT